MSCITWSLFWLQYRDNKSLSWVNNQISSLNLLLVYFSHEKSTLWGYNDSDDLPWHITWTSYYLVIINEPAAWKVTCKQKKKQKAYTTYRIKIHITSKEQTITLNKTTPFSQTQHTAHADYHNHYHLLSSGGSICSTDLLNTIIGILT